MQTHDYDEEKKMQTSDAANHKKANTAPKTLLTYLHDIVFTLLTVLIIIMFFFRTIVVSGPSMNQTLVDGDRILLMNNTLYRKPKAGDVVVVSKHAFRNGEPIIKRIIATEGQRVDIDFDLGVVFVDGKPLNESYTNTPTNLFEGISFPLTVEDDHIFVMGDNRNDSKDSRSTDIGQVDEREVLGKALFVFFPGKDPVTGERYYNRIGAVRNGR